MIKKVKYRFASHTDCIATVIGLGYVGLPLANELSKTKKCLLTNKKISRKIIGYDINEKRLSELRNGKDITNEIPHKDLNFSEILFTSEKKIIEDSDIFIVTVPTPILKNKDPDLSFIKKASLLIGKALKCRIANFYNSSKVTLNYPIVVFESTVYPGATTEFCVPIIEKESGLKFNLDFFCGFSPERINPGDSEHKISDIIKVTSGSTKESADWIDKFYGSFIKAGTHKAENIKTAEAAKIIENIQRDVNIGLVNELAILFKKMDIDTLDVLNAARTKWNFIDFKPGLVGGHCIGVDPYYLTYKAKEFDFLPKMILAGRETNDSIPKWIFNTMNAEINKRNIEHKKLNILILGITFKENCPDLRNSRVIDIIKILQKHQIKFDIYDPFIDPKDFKEKFNIDILDKLTLSEKYSLILVAVAHRQFKVLGKDYLKKILSRDGFIFDIKGIFDKDHNVIRI